MKPNTIGRISITVSNKPSERKSNVSQIITEIDAYQLANGLLREHNLNTWSFLINDRPKRRLGMCNYRDKTIQLSAWVLEKCPERAVNTIRHEVAHALVGYGHRHNHIWKAAAIKLGANPVACTALPMEERPEHTWKLLCPKCGWEGYGSYRKRSRQYRSKCCSAIFVNKRVS